MKITLRDAEGFLLDTRKNLHAIATAHPFAFAVLFAILAHYTAGYLGHVL